MEIATKPLWLRRKMNYPFSYRTFIHPPTPTLDLPDLTSGVWAAPLLRVSLRFTSIEAFDDLNLRFGSRPSPLALSPLTLSIPVGIMNLRRQNKVSAILGQMSPYATSPSTFFSLAVPRSLHSCCPAFSFYPECPKNLKSSIHDTN
jgi:hypothetical protein